MKTKQEIQATTAEKPKKARKLNTAALRLFFPILEISENTTVGEILDRIDKVQESNEPDLGAAILAGKGMSLIQRELDGDLLVIGFDAETSDLNLVKSTMDAFGEVCNKPIVAIPHEMSIQAMPIEAIDKFITLFESYRDEAIERMVIEEKNNHFFSIFDMGEDAIEGGQEEVIEEQEVDHAAGEDVSSEGILTENSSAENSPITTPTPISA